eukprot:scaffold10394_cov173-Amphora_coffeaeformis.AAC.3
MLTIKNNYKFNVMVLLSYLDGVAYPANGEILQECLLQLKPDDIVKYFKFKAYGSANLGHTGSPGSFGSGAHPGVTSLVEYPERDLRVMVREGRSGVLLNLYESPSSELSSARGKRLSMGHMSHGERGGHMTSDPSIVRTGVV